MTQLLEPLAARPATQSVWQKYNIDLFAIALSPTLRAEALYDHDNGPLTGIFGIPDSTEGAVLAPAGRRAAAAPPAAAAAWR
mgnify:CR=1 FL=1